MMVSWFVWDVLHWASDPGISAETVCSAYDKTVESDKPPHVVLDLTWSGISSHVMKALTRNLGLPTVTGSYGKAGGVK